MAENEPDDCDDTPKLTAEEWEFIEAASKTEGDD
jgi:hypothetical protein